LDPLSFRPDFEKIAAAITPKTRALFVNTPHNPSGTVWRREDWMALESLLGRTRIVLVSDEVYEHMVFDQRPHLSASSFSGLAPRSVVISSFGKTLHVTGWKVGTVVAPEALMHEFRKVHQFNVFCVNTPMQVGLAEYLAQTQGYLALPDFYQHKRDHFLQGLRRTRLAPLPCEGTYFQCVDYSAISELSEEDFCRWMTQTVGVAAIPLSAFYAEAPERRVIRFCFAKQETTLDAALERLQAL
jgi:methionine aminotransferase